VSYPEPSLTSAAWALYGKTDEIDNQDATERSAFSSHIAVDGGRYIAADDER
jgi:hypothetical protein